MSKIRMKHITLEWSEAEGFPGVGEFPKVFGSWKDANRMLLTIALQDREIRGGEGGYSKTGFSVEYEDGEVYSGRLDVCYRHGKPDDANIGQHIREFCVFYSGIKCSSHLTKEQYQQVLAQYSDEEIQGSINFLENYEVGE